jgi:hypothetical protein
MRTYDVLFDFGEFPKESGGGDQFAPDAITTSPYAIVAVWRHRFPVTFSRANGKSFSTNPNDATELRNDVLIIVDDLQQLQVQQTKTNHVSQLNATLHTGMNYLVEILPGDWVAAWIVNDEHKMLDIITRLKQGLACNRFYDGIKFLGKIASIRKHITQSPSGTRQSSYSIVGAGFTELDAQIYYEPYLSTQQVGLATDWLRKTGIEINNLINQKKTGIDINSAIPLFLDAFYGQGVPPNQGLGGTGPSTNQGLNNPNAFVIPDPVAATFGVTQGTKSSGKKSWNDICEVVIGIQKYQLSATLSEEVVTGLQNGKPYSGGPEFIFTPDGLSGFDRRHETSFPLLGTFLPSSPQFDGQKTVWAILQQYLNPTINEMYTCLRVNPDGNVMPTLIVRQLPFSSGMLSEQYVPKPVQIANEKTVSEVADRRHSQVADVVGSGGAGVSFNAPRNLTLTRFIELPRWKIHPVLVKEVDLGRSDSMRWNFIHVYGETGLKNQNRAGYIVRDPPIVDDLDVIRSGLRPYMATVHCDPQDAKGRKAGDWMYILSDILMGQHMLLTGTMQTLGITSPICPGDNVEFDEHILHIEAVSHVFAISPNGTKQFRTNLTLSSGVKAHQIDGRDLSLYSGTTQQDLSRFDNSSTEYKLHKTAASDPESGDPEDPVELPRED